MGTRLYHGAHALSNATSGSGLLDVQRVLLRQRKITWKRVLTVTLATGLWVGGSILTISALFDFDEDDEDDLDDESAEMHKQLKKEGFEPDNEDKPEGAEESGAEFIPEEQPENAWFIPLGRSKQLPQTFYHRDDPEWQEFVKFGRDPARITSMKRLVISSLSAALVRGQGPNSILGDNPRCVKDWLYLDFPPGPPREWQQYGIECTPDYVALLYRTRSAADVARTSNAVWPTTVASSVLGALQAVFDKYYKQLRTSWGLNTSQQRPVYPLNAPVSFNADGNPAAADAARSHPTSVSSMSSAVPDSKVDEKAKQFNRVDLLPFLPSLPQQNQGIAEGITLFKKNLARTWKSPRQVPKGSILVRGSVQYRGSRGDCILELAAWYSVTDNKINHMSAAVKQIRRFKKDSPRNPK